MAIDCIPHSEYAARRAKALTALKGALGVLFAGDYDVESELPFRPHPHFEYLSGVVDEPGAVLLLDPGHPVEARRAMLFLSPLNPEREKWDGYRLEISKALRDRTGIESVFRTDMLPRLLTAAAVRAKQLACLHPPAAFNQPVSADLELFRKVAERIPGVSIEDRSDVIVKMRAVKSRHEAALIQRAIDITAAGFEAMMRSVQSGMNEFDVQETIEHAYRSGGARVTAFPTIAGSGVNSTVLHYRANERELADGDMMCVDSGAMFAGYAADITRTVPVNGRFTERQRAVYEVVLKAELAAIKATKPGATLPQIDAVARKIITQAGFGDYFIHSIGHHLGLETHDASPEAPLKTGAVVTIEPGIYIPDEAIGIRIEDDILVTKDGPKNLSAKIPKTTGGIEKTMAGG
ncbi:MAG: aminopeptidase P N-terminal domain-containing protein [Planctomycetota bacterium]|jgi:Xaa-Pro aminopeptidase